MLNSYKESTEHKARYKSHDVISCQATLIQVQSLEPCGSTPGIHTSAFHRPVTTASGIPELASANKQYLNDSLASDIEQLTITNPVSRLGTYGEFSACETGNQLELGPFPVIDNWENRLADGQGDTSESVDSQTSQRRQTSVSTPLLSPIDQSVTFGRQTRPDARPSSLIPPVAQQRSQERQWPYQRFCGEMGRLLPLSPQRMIHPSPDMIPQGRARQLSARGRGQYLEGAINSSCYRFLRVGQSAVSVHRPLPNSWPPGLMPPRSQGVRAPLLSVPPQCMVRPSPDMMLQGLPQKALTQEDAQALEHSISIGYRLLKKAPVRAEVALRKIFPAKLGYLEWRDQCRVITLLARAIKCQGGMKNYKRAIGIILDFRGGRIGLTHPSGDRNLDITLVKLLESTRRYPEAEKLQLAMIGRHLGMAEDELCQSSGHRDTDMSIVRLWQAMEKYTLAEKMLLVMRRKDTVNLLSAIAGTHPETTRSAAEELLCQLSGDTDVDLAQARLWQDMKKHKLAEGMLLAITGRHPEMTDAELFKAISKYDIDLVRQWECMGKFIEAEKMLLSISGRHRGMTDEELCLPTGKYDVDLIHHWTVTGKDALAEKLRNACEYSQPVAQAKVRG